MKVEKKLTSVHVLEDIYRKFKINASHYIYKNKSKKNYGGKNKKAKMRKRKTLRK
mgnify:CR=1 FL=1